MNRSNAFSSNNPPSGSPGVPPPSGTPDSGWASAFQDASEAPPARVWSGIERQLNLDDEDGVLPLYPRVNSRAVVFGRWAAGVAAALLLALLGWWSLRSDTNNARPPSTSNAAASVARSGGYATTRADQQQSGKAPHPAAPKVPNVNSPDALASRVVPHKLGSSPAVNVADDEGLETISVQMSVQQTIRSVSTDESVVRPTGLTRSASTLPAASTETRVAFSQLMQHSFNHLNGALTALPTATERAAETQATVASTVVMATSPLAEKLVSFDRNSVGIQPMTIRTAPMQPIGNERIVWFSPERPDLEPKQKAARKSRPKAWVSAGVVASSFNPSVALRAVSGLAYANTSPSSYALMSGGGPLPALALDSHAGRAIAMQATVGVPLSDHWTIETGVGYLTGQSTVQSPVRSAALLTEKNSAANLPTLYTDLIGSSANRSVTSSANAAYDNAATRNAFVASTSYDRAVSQSVSNNYQFVQVPVQLSYELRPRRKFGLALITGMVSNLFVRNTVADALTVKAQDGVYRPLTVAGTAGMRLRFRPSKQWSASLAGTFQQSLQSISRPEVGIQALPRNMGVCFSVDRHF